MAYCILKSLNKYMSVFIGIVDFMKYLSVLITACMGLQSSKTKLEVTRQKKRKERFIHSHDAIASVYPILQTALNKFAEVDRVSVFRSHNGDGIPTPGKQAYTTCIQEVISYRTTPIIERWQSIPADMEMTNIISELIIEDKCIIQITEPSGILSDYAAGNGIKSVLAVPVAHLDSGFLFLNFCSTSSEDLTGVDGVLFEAHSVAARVGKLYASHRG